jgi:hypothetical protein
VRKQAQFPALDCKNGKSWATVPANADEYSAINHDCRPLFTWILDVAVRFTVDLCRAYAQLFEQD